MLVHTNLHTHLHLYTLSHTYTRSHTYIPPSLPLQQAANKLQVGVTTLKKVCRQGGVTRWPFRKRSSLDNLIEKTARFIKVTDESTARHKELALAALQQQKLNLQVLVGWWWWCMCV